eukprot:1182441-Rhodomonas_salina.2
MTAYTALFEGCHSCSTSVNSARFRESSDLVSLMLRSISRSAAVSSLDFTEDWLLLARIRSEG